MNENSKKKVPRTTQETEQIQIRHYGFAIVPRIVIRGEKYKGMSLIERGLYQGIKDICGDDGECFYTYRNLAKELNTSISTLSRYIPVLANKWKLITAEKKCRGNNTNNHEIFHIRIVNVWEENDALYKPQDCFNEKQSSVSDRNKVNEEVKTVSDRNNFVSDRNSIESSQAQLCFYLNDRMISINNTLSEEELDSFVVANADDDTPIFSFPEIDSGITQVSDESFSFAVRDNWKIFRPTAKVTTSSQALEQVLNRLSAPSSEQPSSELSTPAEHLSPESVDKSAQTDNDTSVPPQASEQSYSQPTTNTEGESPDSSGANTPPSEKPARPARQRKPKVVEDPTTQERVEKVLVYFDVLLQEVTGSSGATYGHTKVDAKIVKETLLPCNPTDKRLRKIYLALWNSPRDQRTGFKWSENMSVKAICGQYQSKSIAIMADEQKELDKQKTKDMMETIASNPSLIAQPQEDDLVFDINRVRGNTHRGRRSAS